MDNLTDHFLIATPSLEDPFFGGSVVYMCRHDGDGALGLVINKPSPIPMDAVFSAIDKPVPEQFRSSLVMMGGPVQIDRGFVVHSPCGQWQSSIAVNADTALTTSRDIIERLAENDAVGKLERELEENSWLAVPADGNILFDLPFHERYRAALAKLGIEPVMLMREAGHA